MGARGASPQQGLCAARHVQEQGRRARPVTIYSSRCLLSLGALSGKPDLHHGWEQVDMTLTLAVSPLSRRFPASRGWGLILSGLH